MNFMEAVKEMKAGKKVRRVHYGCKYFIAMDDSDNRLDIIDSNNRIANFNIYDFEADDWEISQLTNYLK